MKTRIFISCLFLMLFAFTGSAMAAGSTSYSAEEWTITGNNDTFIGDGAGSASNSGSHNTFMGYNTGTLNTTGFSNTFLGMNAGYSNTEAYENTFVGRAAGFNNAGSCNSFLGFKAGYSNTTGYYNNFIGQEAGINNTAGDLNNFFGSWTGQSNTTGSYNTFIGDSAGKANVAEHNNTIIGCNADIDGTNDNVTNATAIGSRAYVSAPSSLVLGSIAGVNGATFSVNVGIGTSAPARQLHLVGDNAVFRMDRTKDTAAFLMVRTDASGNPQKTFVVGTNSSGAGTGEFIINDLGVNVSGNGVRRMTIANDGSVTFTGNVYANSFVPSSIAYKNNIRTYENALETVSKLRGVKFEWKNSGKPSVGLIAEEVDGVVPEVVAHDGTNTTGVNYASLVGVLVEAVKEQQGLIKELQARNKRIEQLELKNEQLEQRLLSLEAQ